jgi:hypothetical protein
MADLSGSPMWQETDSLQDESASATADLRARIRHACRRKPTVRLLAKPSFNNLEVRVADVSPLGIALIYHRRLKAGTDLAIELRHDRPELCRILRACVVDALALPRGQWRMCCKFNGELSDEEVLALVR